MSSRYITSFHAPRSWNDELMDRGRFVLTYLQRLAFQLGYMAL